MQFFFRMAIGVIIGLFAFTGSYCQSANISATIGGAAVGPTVSFRLAGKIKPRNATEITASNWSIGGETLDRDYADYNQYKKYLGRSAPKGFASREAGLKQKK